MGERKDKVVQVRITATAREAIVRIAEQYGVTKCQIIRWAIAEYVEREELSHADDLTEQEGGHNVRSYS